MNIKVVVIQHGFHVVCHYAALLVASVQDALVVVESHRMHCNRLSLFFVDVNHAVMQRKKGSRSFERQKHLQ